MLIKEVGHGFVPVTCSGILFLKLLFGMGEDRGETVGGGDMQQMTDRCWTKPRDLSYGAPYGAGHPLQYHSRKH